MEIFFISLYFIEPFFHGDLGVAHPTFVVNCFMYNHKVHQVLHEGHKVLL